ncbi:sporulation protein [Staphylococcus simulans]|uniref:sporulation protein n=1 Tax=Staphylococcus simulans TaxID=1286 RepID=UPI00399AB106
MFEKLLTSLGVGALTVETRLEKDVFDANELISGKVVLKGGDADQQISKIKLSLIEHKENETEHSDFDEMENILQVYEINSEQVIEADQTVEKSFEFPLEKYKFQNNTDALTLRTYVYIDNGADAEEDAEITIK